MYRRIVVPLDGSELSERALPDAEGVARLAGASLLLVRAVDPTALSRIAGFGAAEYAVLTEALAEEEAAAREYLRHTEQAVAARGVAVSSQLRRGPAARVIVDATAAGDLVAMASHGRGGMARWFLGSVAEEVARRSPVPVLLVRSVPADTAPGEGSGR